ncbi:hypothetical protein PtA15_11A199 [Puccinia triticina]|uniref:Uncharacterized protein n=1 Tax=Puccinia triticina TaxID=208348 RepID=A0ABY7D0F1_9BASI|nr:uncharacterized protein PtA15_11A199 [Puccinia triticina]WAQ89510.1 hypothetical protein PtA15_11A199 [Puccinia triticina]
MPAALAPFSVTSPVTPSALDRALSPTVWLRLVGSCPHQLTLSLLNTVDTPLFLSPIDIQQQTPNPFPSSRRPITDQQSPCALYWPCITGLQSTTSASPHL